MTDRASAPLRVLVVEDNLDSAETLEQIISMWGHEVQLAHDGAGALRLAREFRPQVILLDIGLPDMDGYAVAHRLRGEDLGGDVLVALTGYGEAQDRAGAGGRLRPAPHQARRAGRSAGPAARGQSRTIRLRGGLTGRPFPHRRRAASIQR